MHVATPYGVTGHLHIPAYSAPSAAATTVAQIQMVVSPLEVVLDPNQQLAVTFKNDGDFTIAGFASTNAETITMKCFDKNVCQADPKVGAYTDVVAVVSDNSQSYGTATLKNDNTKDWPLNLNTEKTWESIQSAVFPGSGQVYQASKRNFRRIRTTFR